MCNRGYALPTTLFPPRVLLSLPSACSTARARALGMYKSIICTIPRPLLAADDDEERAFRRSSCSLPVSLRLVPAPYFTNDSASFFDGGVAEGVGVESTGGGGGGDGDGDG